MAIPALNITENYAALAILRQTHLNTAMTSIETYVEANVRLNLNQLALDCFGAAYTLDSDGLANQATPLIDLCAQLAQNETVTGNWTFNGSTSLAGTLSSTSTLTSSGQQRARAWRNTTNQSLADATTTGISFNAETYDVGSMHDNAVNPTRITVPAGGAGTYDFKAQVTFAANVTGRREVYIYKNGSQIAEVKEFGNSATEETALQVSCHDTAAAADFYEVFAFQNSTAALDVVLGERVTFFTAHRDW